MDKLKFDSLLEHYFQNYEVVYQEVIEANNRMTLKDTPTGVCRFCGQRAPNVTFKDVAHAIPEMLGNRSLFSKYECDICNHQFGDSIESDLAAWSKPMRTFSRIRGKKGVPSQKGGNEFVWRVDADMKSLKIKEFEHEPIAKLDEVAKTLTFDILREPYTPVGVMKAFVKCALTLLPQNELAAFTDALSWIKCRDHSIRFVGEKQFPIIRTFVSGPMPNNLINLTILRRRSGSHCSVYTFFILSYGNEMYQIIIPSPPNDIPGDFTIKVFPHPIDYKPIERCKVVFRKPLDLTGCDRIKGDREKIVMSFEDINECLIVD